LRLNLTGAQVVERPLSRAWKSTSKSFTSLRQRKASPARSRPDYPQSVTFGSMMVRLGDADGLIAA